jgi:hypothetical protein
MIMGKRIGIVVLPALAVLEMCVVAGADSSGLLALRGS